MKTNFTRELSSICVACLFFNRKKTRRRGNVARLPQDLPESSVCWPTDVMETPIHEVTAEVLQKLDEFRRKYHAALDIHDLVSLNLWRAKLVRLQKHEERNGHYSVCPMYAYTPGADIDVVDSCVCNLPGFVHRRLILWERSIESFGTRAFRRRRHCSLLRTMTHWCSR